MKLHWRLSVTLLASCTLLGCSARFSAPVMGLTKDYGSIGRGSYRGSFYEVKKGDTLYFISYITNKNVNDIIAFNDLEKPYIIHPGQRLRLWQPRHNVPHYGKASAPVVAKSTSSTSSVASSSMAVAAAPVVMSSSVKATPSSPAPKSATTKPQTQKPKTHHVAKPHSTPPPAVVKTEPTTQNRLKSNTKVNNVKKDHHNKVESSHSNGYVSSKGKQNVNVVSKSPANTKVSKWIWPTKGRIIKGFSTGDQGNKGIDIAGQRGQSVVSTAKGSVVYSGNALKGYGNLIIIKHNDNYLSAYAHNERLLVNEGQTIKAGQKIATMGSSGTSSVRLHFEIRYQGKSVNPKRYLP